MNVSLRAEGANMDTVNLHHTLLKGLYRDKVLTVMAKYSARFLKPQNDGSEKKQGVTNLFRSDPQKATAAEAAFVAVGSALSGSDFAAELDDMFYDRGSEGPPCTVRDAFSAPLIIAPPQCIARTFTTCETCTACAEIQHINTGVQLEMEMKQLCKDGCIDLLEEEMPVACTVIKHHDIFLALLP